MSDACPRQTASPNRRHFLKYLACSTAAVTLRGMVHAQPKQEQDASGQLPPVRTVTRGPKFHWRGYYDKQLFDPSNRYLLSNEVDFEGRSPRADDVIRVGMVDLRDNDRWIQLGTSRAWNWRQGCMLQWLPGSESTVVWNDREGDRFVCHVLDVKTRRKRTLVFSLADAAAVPFTGREDRAPKKEAKHWLNHLLVNTDGSRILFLHRWKAPSNRSFMTRMFTADPDGANRMWVERLVGRKMCLVHPASFRP